MHGVSNLCSSVLLFSTWNACIFLCHVFFYWTDFDLHGANNRKCIWNSMCLWGLLNVGCMEWCSKLCQWLNESRYHHFSRSSLTFVFALLQSRLRAWQCVSFAYFTFCSVMNVAKSKSELILRAIYTFQWLKKYNVIEWW